MTKSTSSSPDYSSEPSTATTSAEPGTPNIEEHHVPPARRATKNQLDELIEIGHWYTNMGGGSGGPATYTRTARKPKKSLEQQMIEDEARDAEKRRIKREANKIKREAELAKKRAEEERIKQEKLKAKLKEKLEKQRLQALKRSEINKENSKNSNKKTKYSNSKIKLEKSSSPEIENLRQVKTKKQNNNEPEKFLSFLNLTDDVEIPIKEGFFIPEIYNNSIESIQNSIKFKSAAELIKENPKKYKPYHDFEPQIISLKSVIYPNISEDYLLLESQDLQLDPIEEIGRIMELSALTYFPDEYKLTVFNPKDPTKSIAGKYLKAYFAKDYSTVLKLIKEYNQLISKIHSKNGFLKHLQNKKTISRKVLHEFLNQFYSRSVSPQVNTLKGYKAFSNNVYGELLPKFLSQVFDQNGLNSNSTFIDLGSGVGNVSLQAALEYGCTSYGCEMMENCSILADDHVIAFKDRCKLFGLNPGKVELFNNQSFVDNEIVKRAVDKCDVILVNNFLFGADLNKEAMKLFSNLKPGTKIISLKSIIPDSYIINFNDIDNYMNKFEVSAHEFDDNSVSWTSKGGRYYVTEYTGLISERALAVFNTRSRDRKVLAT